MQIELLTMKYHMEMPNLRHQIEARARQMEGRDLGQQAATPAGKPDAQKYDRSRQGAAAGLASEAKVYNADADVTATAGKEEKKKVGSTQTESFLVHVYVSSGSSGALNRGSGPAGWRHDGQWAHDAELAAARDVHQVYLSCRSLCSLTLLISKPAEEGKADRCGGGGGARRARRCGGRQRRRGEAEEEKEKARCGGEAPLSLWSSSCATFAQISVAPAAVVRFAFHTACGWERVEARAACDRTRWSTQDEAAAEAAEEEAPKKKKKKKAAAEAAADETNGEPVKVRDKRVLLSACLSVFSAPSCTWWASSAAIEHILTAVDVCAAEEEEEVCLKGRRWGSVCGGHCGRLR